jgi:hypothetical protein
MLPVLNAPKRNQNKTLNQEQIDKLFREIELLGEEIIAHRKKDDFRSFLRAVHTLADWAVQPADQDDPNGYLEVDAYAPVQRRIVERSLNRLKNCINQTSDNNFELSDLVDTTQGDLARLVSLKIKSSN